MHRAHRREAVLLIASAAMAMADAKGDAERCVDLARDCCCVLVAGVYNAAEGGGERIRGDATASMTGCCNCPCHLHDPLCLEVAACGSNPSRCDGTDGDTQPDAPEGGGTGADAAAGGDTQPVAVVTAAQGMCGCAALGGLVLRVRNIASPAMQGHDTKGLLPAKVGDSVQTKDEPLHGCSWGPTVPLDWQGC